MKASSLSRAAVFLADLFFLSYAALVVFGLFASYDKARVAYALVLLFVGGALAAVVKFIARLWGDKR